jgi:uncharacterized glyoxalase superfamily protein PhnB
MSTETSNSNYNADVVTPISYGYKSITPRIFVKSSADAIEFYKQVFDAIEESRYTVPIYKNCMRSEKVIHAVLRIGNSKFLLAGEFPEMCERPTSAEKIEAPGSIGGNSVFLSLYFENVDNIFDKAQKRGATVVMPLMDAFWSDRYGQSKDPFGNIWEGATHKKDVSFDSIPNCRDSIVSIVNWRSVSFRDIR